MRVQTVLMDRYGPLLGVSMFYSSQAFKLVSFPFMKRLLGYVFFLVVMVNSHAGFLSEGSSRKRGTSWRERTVGGSD